MKELVVKGKRIGEGRPLVCVPVMEASGEKIVQEIVYLSESNADMIEWRLDAFEKFHDSNAVKDVLMQVSSVLNEKILVYTFRSKSQGGLAEIDTETLEMLHEVAIESGCVDFVDLEYFEADNPKTKIAYLQEKGVYVIASHHNFNETPEAEEMKKMLEEMRVGGADIVKLAVMPNTIEDVLQLLSVTTNFHEENKKTPIITMSMGKLGSISRLSGETFGSCVTFGAHEKPSAPGQYEMNRLREILDAIHESNER